MARLEATEAALDGIVSGLTREASRWKPSAARWSAAEIVAHLADAEIMMGVRFRQLLTQPEGGPILAYDQNGWAAVCACNEIPVLESMEKFRVLRRSNLRLWKALTSDQLARVGVHPERGESTVAALLTLLANHDSNHLKQMRATLDECGLSARRAEVGERGVKFSCARLPAVGCRGRDSWRRGARCSRSLEVRIGFVGDQR